MRTPANKMILPTAKVSAGKLKILTMNAKEDCVGESVSKSWGTMDDDCMKKFIANKLEVAITAACLLLMVGLDVFHHSGFSPAYEEEEEILQRVKGPGKYKFCDLRCTIIANDQESEEVGAVNTS